MESGNKGRAGAVLCAIFLSIAIFSEPAQVQGAEQAKNENTRDTADAPFMLNEVIVTARRREEIQQKVPVTITSISEQEIQQTNLENMNKVIQMTPGLNGMQSGLATSSSFNVRGVGTVGALSGWEDGAISAYLDGVPVPLGLLDSYILDVERIEVLRGPQGTLYGKTAQGGAINLTTKAPQGSPGGSIGTTVGTKGLQGATAMLTGPIVQDKLNGRFFFDAQRRDTLVKDKASDEPVGKVDRYFFRGALDGFWTDSFSTRLNISYDKFENEDVIPVPMQDYNSVSLASSPREKRNTLSVGLINKIELSKAVNLYFTTGFNKIDYDTKTETITSVFPSLDESEYHVNQEIRLDGTNGPLEWTAGVFGSYFKRDINHSGTSATISYQDKGEQTANTLAVFGEGTYSLSDKWKITAGLRLNRDYRSVDETVKSSLMAVPHSMQENKTHFDWNGRIILSFLPTDTATLYASVARGYKPGGYQTYHNTAFQGMAKRTPDFKESTSMSYELGYKGIFFDKRLSLDTAVFYNDIKGESILGYTPTLSSVFYNVDSHSYGLEVASRLLVSENLTLGASAALTRAELKEDLILLDMGPQGRDEVKKGDALPSVPEFSAYVFGEYRKTLSENYAGFIRSDYAWRSATYMDITHYAKNSSYGLLGLSLGVNSNNFSAMVYANNLTDERYYTYALGNFMAMAVYPAPGREIGFKMSYEF